jgi:starvation-inducible DNA-binding protein
MDIGLTDQARKKVAAALNEMLATTYALYLKTQNFHWNLRGPRFFFLHKFFEQQYEELAEAIDEIAERIRAIGFNAEGTFPAFSRLSSIKESKPNLTEEAMLADLLQGHEILAKKGRPLIKTFQKIGDEVSADLLIKRLTVHEKQGWMIRAHLEKI